MPDTMPEPNERPSSSPMRRKARRYDNQVALAMELPFTFVGAVFIGGLLGYFLDRWLHTRMLFMLVLGGVGFYAGLREVLRRLDGSGNKGN